MSVTALFFRFLAKSFQNIFYAREYRTNFIYILLLRCLIQGCVYFLYYKLYFFGWHGENFWRLLLSALFHFYHSFYASKLPFYLAFYGADFIYFLFNLP